MDVLGAQLFLHIFKVHPPYAGLVPLQGAEHHVVAVVGEGAGEAHVGGGVEQHLAAPGAGHVQRADHAAQHAVLVADAFPGQPGHAVAVFLPGDDGVKVFIGGVKVAVGRVLRPADKRLGHGGHGGKVHVRHPHGDGVETRLGRGGGKPVRLAQTIHRDGVLAVAVRDGSEIVFHVLMFLSEK